MTQRKEHSWNERYYENRRTPVWVMMLTSPSCCRHVQQDLACSFSVRQDSDISTHMYIKISSSLDDVMSSTREDVIRRRHLLLRCADSSLNHEWSKTVSFVSCLDACLDAVGVRSPLHWALYTCSDRNYRNFRSRPKQTVLVLFVRSRMRAINCCILELKMFFLAFGIYGFVF
jgi:hypothetical protein